MRLVVQRVKQASVTVDGRMISSIGAGLMVLVGISRNDLKTDAEFCARKLLNMRLFNVNDQPWRASVKDAQLEILLVSQFTLYGTLNGNKPDFHESMKSDLSREFYNDFVSLVKKQYIPEKVQEGEFGAMMDVCLINDGPVTLQVDSRKFQYVENTQNTPKADTRNKQPNKKPNQNNSNNNNNDINQNNSEIKAENSSLTKEN